MNKSFRDGFCLFCMIGVCHGNESVLWCKIARLLDRLDYLVNLHLNLIRCSKWQPLLCINTFI